MNTRIKVWTLALALLTGGSYPADAAEETAVASLDASETGAAVAPPADSAPVGNQDEILLNFRNAPLVAVLEHLSKAAGFAIVKEVDFNERVEVWSYQPLTRDEAIELLNTVLFEKGYAAVRNDRTLLIVTREEAVKRGIPVKTGADPNAIPKSDAIVTQIIPVRYADAVKLIENIKGLLPTHATITANESSNAIVLTDTQTSVRRIAEVVRALDTSISDIATLKVFPLKYSDAKEAAELINKVFETQQPSDGNNTPGFPPFFGGGRRGRGGGDEGENNENSEARRAASRVLAAADERTNALVVTAPEDLMPTIEELVQKIDTSQELDAEIRVFTLRYADAEETAKVITSLYTQNSQTALAANAQNNQGGPGGRFFRRMMEAQQAAQQAQNTSQRKLKESQVNAVADLRTNSIVVSAVSGVMEQIAATIERLDSNPAKAQKVYVYNVKNANVSEVAEIIDQMFNQEPGTGSTLNRNNAGNNAARQNSNTNRNNQNSNTNNRNNSGGNFGGNNFGRN